MGAHKTKDVVRDEEFDELERGFKDCMDTSKSLLKAFEDSQKNWESIQGNCKKATEAVKSATDAEEWVKELGERANQEVNWALGSDIKNNAITFLKGYIKFCKDITSEMSDRASVVKDVNYYRGKVDDLQNSSKPKDKEKLPKATQTLEELELKYEQLNGTLKERLKYAYELKSHAYGTCLVAFFESQTYNMNNCPFYKYLEEYGGALEEPFPDLSSYQPSFVASADVSRRGSRRDVAPSRDPNAYYVRALYRFDAENAGELTFDAGAEIQWMRDIDDDWMEGMCEGQTGVFPRNWVEVIE